MKRFFVVIKASLLLGALLVLAWSAVPGISTASAALCSGKGDTCAVIIGDKIYYFKEIE